MRKFVKIGPCEWSFEEEQKYIIREWGKKYFILRLSLDGGYCYVPANFIKTIFGWLPPKPKDNNFIFSYGTLKDAQMDILRLFELEEK
jgi:hypothetical protein